MYRTGLRGDSGRGVTHADLLGTVDGNEAATGIKGRCRYWSLHLPIPAVLEPTSGSGFVRTQPSLWFLFLSPLFLLYTFNSPDL